MINGRNYFTVLTVALILAGCAGNPRVPSVASACLQAFEQLDEQLVSKARHDAAAYRIPGYPYLRLSRFMASFSGELDHPDKQRSWVEALREEDQQARVIELQNLGMTAPVSAETLEDCGNRLVKQLLQNASEFNRLLELAVVPDDYSVAARLLGLYPLAVPFMRKGVLGYQAEVLQDYSHPLDTPPGARLRVWRPPTRGSTLIWGDVSDKNVLGIPQISHENWLALARQHAPVWQVEVASEDDLPGTVNGQTGPVINSAEMTTYLHTGFTRFSGQVLPQLVYVLWFPRRTAAGPFDPYAGEFDSVLWRVTLGPDGHPLAYDTIHGCGCYHYFFAVNASLKDRRRSWWQESILAPQSEVPKGPVMLRLQAGTHYLRRVLPVDEGKVNEQNPQFYAIQDYDQLRSFDAGRGQNSSLFTPDGLIPGSERLERFWLWPSGVSSPGAMRQIGRHATAFIGRRHFDDPHLFEGIFSQ